MKTLISLTISILLLISCKKEEIEKEIIPRNGDVSFTIDGKSYSSPLNWSISVLYHGASQLIIKDTLGFDFSEIMLLNNSGICGIVIPAEYKHPRYNQLYFRDQSDSCFVLRSDWDEGLNLEFDSLAVFKIINGNFETNVINCETVCGYGLLSGRNVCNKYCDYEGTFSFEAKNGYSDSISVSDGHYIAYSQIIY